jgi:hypothetical protein
VCKINDNGKKMIMEKKKMVTKLPDAENNELV